MSADSISTANYAAVITDLRAKRDELDRAIAMLETMANVPQTKGNAAVAPPAVKPSVAEKPRENAPSTGIGQACFEALKEAGRPLTNRDVVDFLESRGYPINGQNKVNNVGAALYHRAKTSKDVERFDRIYWRVVSPQNGYASH